MSKLPFALLAVLVLVISGCATTKTEAPASVAAVDSGSLPDIMAYDDEVFETLPDLVAAE